MNKKLYKSRNSRMLCGVCGGVAEYFGLDPTLVRLGWVIFCALGGSGILAYLIAAVIIPEQPVYSSYSVTHRSSAGKQSLSSVSRHFSFYFDFAKITRSGSPLSFSICTDSIPSSVIRLVQRSTMSSS